MNKILHSVRLDEKRCIGCTDCIKRCPTEAIRVRNGKATIKDELCIDCGECIRVCKSYAKKAVIDGIDIVQKYKYRIALPAPTLYSQFENINDSNIILTAVKRLGFEDIFEVSAAAELVTRETKEYIARDDVKKPIISSACPAVVRLIAMRFPELRSNLLPMLSPMEVAARIAKQSAMKKHGLKKNDIGVFFISPCAAKKTNITYPLGSRTTSVDGVLGISDLYLRLRNIIAKLETDDIEILSNGNNRGINWAGTGGESGNIRIDNAIAVDGMEDVINILEEIDNGRLTNVDFIEALACTGGCLGGPLTVNNCFVAKNILKKLQSNMILKGNEYTRNEKIHYEDINFYFSKEIEEINALHLDVDVSVAIEKMTQIDELTKKLPSIDCGACGAPTCRALAEDIVQNEANIEECIFMLRNKVKEFAEQMVDLTSKMPQIYKNIKKHD